MKPREKVPQLSLKTINGEVFKLSDHQPKNFTMLIFYRGLHCPVCKTYLEELNGLVEKFTEKGVDVIAVSMNNQELAEKTAEEWNIEHVKVAYGLSESDANAWGLFLSTGMGESEPPVFAEPGLFLVKPDGELYYSSIQSMPFGRPKLREMLGAVDFVLEHKYPARGEK
ncbi:peroxiredoxin [Pedobacter sp. UYP30]|uniref:peroxiredoxin family protein n=1 Tax=Pedobacter sp. UYP30 TaxID=1756400 RepID=UPI0033998319